MSKPKYYINRKNELAATCIFGGANNFVRVDARASLSVADLRRHEPKLYESIGQDFERGFRTTDDPLHVALHTAMFRYCRPYNPISYIGKAEMRIYLHSNEMANFQKEVKAIRELLQAPLRFDHGGLNEFSIRAPVDKEVKEDRHGRTRSIPKVNHCFQQVRPLAVKYLREDRADRENLIVSWQAMPFIDLEWE